MNIDPLNLEPEEMSIDSLPQINDESLIENKFTERFTQPLTGPIHIQQNDIYLQQDLTTNQTLQMPTMPIDLMNAEPQRKTSIPIFKENEQQLNGKILNDMPSIGDLSIDELDDKENILPDLVAQKRDSSNLTPRCPRSSKITKNAKSDVSIVF